MKHAITAVGTMLALALAFASPSAAAQPVDWNATTSSLRSPLQLESGWFAQGTWRWESSLRWADSGAGPALQQTLALTWQGALDDRVDTRVTVGRVSGGGEMSPFVMADVGFDRARFQLRWSERDWAGSVRWDVLPGLTVQVNVLGNRPHLAAPELYFPARDCARHSVAQHCF